MRDSTAALVTVFIIAIPASGSACEPIIPLYQLLGGSSLAGPSLLRQSLSWLAAAVVIKCAAFAFFERRLQWRTATAYMLLANVVSTVPGVLIAGFTASIGGVILAVPIIFVLGRWVERRLAFLPKPQHFGWMSGGGATLGFMGVVALSFALFGLAGTALEERRLAAYWVLKFLFVAIAAGTGILISAVLEECVIARISGKSRRHASFYAPVLRANYVTLSVVLFVAALEMLPRRLQAPHFIVSWLQAISSVCGT